MAEENIPESDDLSKVIGWSQTRVGQMVCVRRCPDCGATYSLPPLHAPARRNFRPVSGLLWW